MLLKLQSLIWSSFDFGGVKRTSLVIFLVLEPLRSRLDRDFVEQDRVARSDFDLR